MKEEKGVGEQDKGGKWKGQDMGKGGKGGQGGGRGGGLGQTWGTPKGRGSSTP